MTKPHFEPILPYPKNDGNTQVRHVTKFGTNLFRELCFAPDEAERFQAESQRQINDTQALKAQLIQELSKWISDNPLKQADAAEILMLSRPVCRMW